ncbi:MAG: PIN domain-containing protein [Brevinematales bacterium]|nr:PIN domain-containing protein [Brevinematales bacterium]
MKIEEPFLIDTNILIYALNKDSAYYDFSRKIINDNGENIYLAYKSVAEFVCVMSKMGRYDIIELE